MSSYIEQLRKDTGDAYSDLSDSEIAQALHNKYQAESGTEVDFNTFASEVGLDTSAPDFGSPQDQSQADTSQPITGQDFPQEQQQAQISPNVAERQKTPQVDESQLVPRGTMTPATSGRFAPSGDARDGFGEISKEDINNTLGMSAGEMLYDITPEDPWTDILQKNIQDIPSKIQRGVAGALDVSSPLFKELGMFDYAGKQEEPLTRTASQALWKDAQSKVEENQPFIKHGTAKYYGASILNAVEDMGLSVASSMLTKNPTLGLGVMTGQVFLNKKAQSLSEGKSEARANLDATVYAMAEGWTEKIPLGILTQPGQKWLSRTLKEVGAEGLQEPLSQGIELAYDQGIFKEGEPLTLREVMRQLWDAGIIGMGAGGVLAVTTGGLPESKQKQVGRELRSLVEQTDLLNASDLEIISKFAPPQNNAQAVYQEAVKEKANIPGVSYSAPQQYGAAFSMDRRGETRGEERRQNLEQRIKVQDMTPEEMKKALLTSDVTGIKNRRAYEETPRKPVQVSIDADSLKWINKEMSPATGDKLLKTVAQAINEETDAGFHFSGDEFMVEADTPEEANQIMERVNERLKQAEITAKKPDGTIIVKKGLEITHGIGETKDAADYALSQEKTAREQRGERAARGEAPPGVVITAPEGQQNIGREAPAEEVKQIAPKKFVVGENEYYTTESGKKYKNNSILSDDEYEAAYKKSLEPSAEKPVKPKKKNGFETVFRGKLATQKEGGNFYSLSKDFAREFTQSGLDSEIETTKINRKDIFYPGSPVFAGDVAAVDSAIEEAKKQGFKAVELSEGKNQPNSIFIIDQASVKSPAPKETKKASSTAAPRLRRAADTMEKTIQEKLNPGVNQQAPTARRARIAAGMESEGRRMQRIQGVMRNLADAQEAGTTSETLSKITSRAEVETLLSREEIPAVRIDHRGIKELLEAAKGLKGISDARATVTRISGIDNIITRPTQIAAIDTLVKAANKAGKKPLQYTYALDQIKAFNRAKRLGIDTQERWTAARKELLDMEKPVAQVSEKEKTVKELERELIGTKIPGFFATPQPVIDEVMAELDLDEGMSVLEPEAGNGDMADAAREAGGKVDVIEISGQLQEVLKAKEHNLVATDFMSYTGKKYDRILMNPPFEKQADIDHVLHAYELLKPGGRLVAVMSESTFFRDNKKSVDFRSKVDEFGHIVDLPEGAFKKGKFRTTGVKSRIVVMDKPGKEGEVQSSIVQGEKPLSESKFYSQYAQHIDLRGKRAGTAKETAEKILKEGFKKGANVNAMPPYRGGETKGIGGRFAPKKGDFVYLAPKGAWKDKANGIEIQDGWKPKPYEVIQITEDNPDMYQEYLKSFEKHKQKPAATRQEVTAPKKGKTQASKGGIQSVWAPGDTYVPMLRGKPITDITIEAAQVPEKLIRREHIIKKMERLFGVKIYRGRVKGKTRLGFFRASNSEIRTKEHNDLEVTAHEVTHWLDDRYPAFSRAYRREPFKSELKGISYDVKNIKEGFAEFGRLYMTQESEAVLYAPKFYDKFIEIMKAEGIQDKVDEIKDEMHKWYNQGGVERFRSKTGTEPEPLRQRIAAAADGLVDAKIAQVFDALHGLKVMERNLTGTIGDADVSPYKGMRNLAGSRAVVKSVFEHGTIDYGENGDIIFTGKGLREIFEPVANIFDDTMLYFAARRASELMKQGREHHYEPDEIKAVLELADAHPEMKNAFDEYQAFNSRMMDFYEHSGLINKESRKAMEEMNKDYVPFFRVQEEITGEMVTKRSGTPFKRLKGGTANVADIFDNITFGTATLVHEALANRAKVRAYNMVSKFKDGALYAVHINKEIKPTDVEIRQLEDAFIKGIGMDPKAYRKAQSMHMSDPNIDGILNMMSENLGDFMTFFTFGHAPKGTDIDSVMIDGKREFYQIADPMFMKAIESMNAKPLGMAMRIMAGFKNGLTRTITAMPDFQIPNILRDSFNGFALSHGGMIPVIDSVRGAYNRIMTDDTYWEFMANGGGYASTVHGETQATRRHLEKLYNAHGIDYRTVLDTPAKLMEMLEEFNSAFEYGTRLAEYKAMRKKGVSMQEAAFQGREVSTDFAMRGYSEFIRFFSTSVPFFNARLQGLYRLEREAFETGGKQVKWGEHAGRLALRGLIGITIPSLVLYFINRDDPRYRKLHEWEKDLHWVIFIPGSDIPHFIPKPFEVGSIFATIPERMMQFYIENNGEQFASAMKRVFLDTFSLNPIPQIIKPIVETEVSNMKFTGAPIIPEDLKDVESWEQFRPYTSDSMVKLGKALHVSPLKLEHWMRGYFGTLGLYAMMGADGLIGDKFGGEVPEKRIDEIPVYRRFVRQQPYRGTSYETQFYQLAEETRRVTKTFNKIRNEGRTKDLNEYIGNNDRELLFGLQSSVTEVMQNASMINQGIRMIRQDPKLSGREKRKQIDNLQQQKNDLMETAAKSLNKRDLIRIQNKLDEVK